MREWIPIRSMPMTEEDIKYWGLEKGAVTYLNPMPDDGEIIWVTNTKGDVAKEVCIKGDGYYLLGSKAEWSEVLAWMPVDVPKPYRGPDPRPIDATALLREIDANPGATPGDVVSMIHRQPTTASKKIVQMEQVGEGYKCSGCGGVFMYVHRFNYCPVCGGKIEVSK